MANIKRQTVEIDPLAYPSLNQSPSLSVPNDAVLSPSNLNSGSTSLYGASGNLSQEIEAANGFRVPTSGSLSPATQLHSSQKGSPFTSSATGGSVDILQQSINEFLNKCR